jgi:hypothetical protein
MTEETILKPSEILENETEEMNRTIKELEAELDEELNEPLFKGKYDISGSLFFKHTKLNAKYIQKIFDIYYEDKDLKKRDLMIEELKAEADKDNDETKKLINKVYLAYKMANFTSQAYPAIFINALKTNILKIYNNEVRLRRSIEDLYTARNKSGFEFNAFLPELADAVLVHFGFRLKDGAEKKYDFGALFSIVLSKVARKVSPFDACTNFFIMMLMKNISIWSYMTQKQVDEYPEVNNQIREFFKLLVLVYSATNPPTKEELEARAKEITADVEDIKDTPLQEATNTTVQRIDQ